jgi:hypothetical protein
MLLSVKRSAVTPSGKVTPWSVYAVVIGAVSVAPEMFAG